MSAAALETVARWFWTASGHRIQARRYMRCMPEHRSVHVLPPRAWSDMHVVPLGHRNHRQRKPYVWQHSANWDRDGWNGVSYTGNEPNVIRMRFDRKINRQGKRATKGITRRFLMRSLRIYRGFKRRRKLIEFRRVLG